jgi:hypothetical protein
MTIFTSRLTAIDEICLLKTDLHAEETFALECDYMYLDRQEPYFRGPFIRVYQGTRFQVTYPKTYLLLTMSIHITAGSVVVLHQLQDNYVR